MANLEDVVNNTKTLYMSDSALDTLMDFERVVDELDVYAFKHWLKGELVEGPVYEKYFVTCKFMWPYKFMPDPSAAKRLVDYGCHVTYEEGDLSFPMKINGPEDFRNQGNLKKGKMQKTPVWIVTIIMPRDLIKDIRQGSVEIEGDEIDLGDLETAYDEGLDNEAITSDEDAMNNDTPEPEEESDLDDQEI